MDIKTNTAKAPVAKAAQQDTVPPGYRRTEVGVIPEDWDVIKVRDFGEVVTGGTPPTAIREYWNGDFPWVTPTDISDLKNIYTTDREITEKGIDLVGKLPPGTVLATCIASIGKNAILCVSGSCNQQINAVIPHSKTNSDFLYYLFESKTNYLLSSAGITATSIISKSEFEKLLLPLPTLPEQRAIAKALSDVDALTAALDKLIAKKRAIKQAAMQQLLTGKTRLPGFSGEWKRRRLSEMLMYERPDKYIVSNTDYAATGDVPVLTANKGFILGYTYEMHSVCRDLPVIVFDDFTTDCKYADFPFKVKSSAIKLLRPINDQVDLRYIFARMQLIRFPIGEHKRYYISEYQNIELSVPDHGEQTAIAKILSDMDAEIEALEKRRAKTRQIKQGMMQQLLTGRVRLINQEATA